MLNEQSIAIGLIAFTTSCLINVNWLGNNTDNASERQRVSHAPAFAPQALRRARERVGESEGRRPSD
jgi:hypothetical protein